MDRIAIIGNGGGGKSTLARRLNETLGLPWYQIDLIQWKPGWERASREEFDAAHDAYLRQPRWIIDGWGPADAMEQRFGLADTIIWVDFPIRVHLWWVAKRQVKSFLGHDTAPPGCSYWRVTIRMFRLIWRIHRTMRPELQALIDAGARRGGGQVIRLSTPPEWRQFLAGVG